MTRLTFLFALLSSASLACATGTGESATAVTIDTLPGGIVRTMNHTPADSGHWSLVLDRTIDPPDGAPNEFSAVTDLALGDDGLLYISESNPVQIKVLAKDGSFLRNIGRKGDGPGEFNTGYLALHGDTLLVHDPRGAGRTSTFLTADGTFLAVRPTVCCHYAALSVDGGGRAIVPTIVQPDSLNPSVAFARIAFDGKGIDTVSVTERRKVDGARWQVMEGGRMQFEMQVPLRPRGVHTADASGGFLTGWNSEFLLRLSRNGADTVSLFGRDYQPEPITTAMKQGIVDAIVKRNQEDTPEATLRAAFVPSAIPDQRPAYDRIWTDRTGRRWVQLSSNDTTRITLDLFNTEGRWLDELQLTGDGWPKTTWAAASWARDEVAVLLEGDDGRDVVKIYRIVHRP